MNWSKNNKFIKAKPGVIEDAAIKEYIEDKEAEANYNTSQANKPQTIAK